MFSLVKRKSFIRYRRNAQNADFTLDKLLEITRGCKTQFAGNHLNANRTDPNTIRQLNFDLGTGAFLHFPHGSQPSVVSL